MSLLEVQELVKSYGRRRVVDGVSFHVDAGEVVGLLGPNGAGKTTSFRMTTGMISPDAGKVLFAGRNVSRWPMYKRARLGMGYLSQESSVFRKLTVEQNILAILEAMPPSRTIGRRPSRAERLERTAEILGQFGLTRLCKSRAVTLSGGERRRLEIARCLVCEPLLILLDEPFTGIDPVTIFDIQGIVRELKKHGIGLLVTDHNVRETLKITDRSYVIKEGTVIAEGTPLQIVKNPKVKEEYLGPEFEKELFSSRTETSTADSSPHDSKIYELIDSLKSADRLAAEKELVHIGRSTLPALVEALERRDLEMRRLAFHVLQQILDGAGHFDPYAPVAQRRKQIEILRQQFLRRAG